MEELVAIQVEMQALVVVVSVALVQNLEFIIRLLVQQIVAVVVVAEAITLKIWLLAVVAEL